MCTSYFVFGLFKFLVKFWSFLDFVKQVWNWRGWSTLSATPPKWLNTFQWNFPEILLHILQMCTSCFVFGLFNFLSNCGHFWTLSNKCEMVGRCTLSATPPKWLNRFQWKFQTSFHTYYRCAPPILLLGFLIFCVACVAESTYRDYFVRRLASSCVPRPASCVVPHLHYPQLLLNGWIDFNETFQNSFTHIADVHLLFCFGVFSFFVKFCLQLCRRGGWPYFCVACVAESTHKDHFVRRLVSSCVLRRPCYAMGNPKNQSDQNIR